MSNSSSVRPQSMTDEDFDNAVLAYSSSLWSPSWKENNDLSGELSKKQKGLRIKI